MWGMCVCVRGVTVKGAGVVVMVVWWWWWCGGSSSRHIHTCECERPLVQGPQVHTRCSTDAFTHHTHYVSSSNFSWKTI